MLQKIGQWLKVELHGNDGETSIRHVEDPATRPGCIQRDLSRRRIGVTPGMLGRAARAERERIVSAYRECSAGSAVEFARAGQVLAGGTTGNLRYFAPYPLYFRTGQGSRMEDVDGRALIDCFLCNGPLLLGHRHPAVEQAIVRAARAGSLVVNPPLAADLAGKIQRIVPCAERVRFLNSGTEAVMTAVRLARAHTGRDLIVKFLGHYHGQDDQFLTGLDPTGLPFGAGMPANAHGSTVLAPYGDLDAVERILSGGNVAAVLLDPAMHAGGLWGSSREYLRDLRDSTLRHGTLLIFDEVITGFRLGPGGAQGHFGVTPDLATFAKALGAGEKLAAVVGCEQVFAGLDPDRSCGIRPVFQSGTGNDGATALSAGNAAVSIYQELAAQGRYESLFDQSRVLAEGLRRQFAQAGIPAHVNQLGPMLQLFLTDRAPGFQAFSTIPMEPVELFYLALIAEGVLLSLPRSNHIYLSFAHDDRDIREILEAVNIVLGRYDFGLLMRAASAG